YRRRYGSLASFFKIPPGPRLSAFQANDIAGDGSFVDLAREYGVAQVIEKWVVDTGKTFGRGSRISLLSKYFGAIQYVGGTYLATFSGMRSAEINRLRADCLTIDRDE